MPRQFQNQLLNFIESGRVDIEQKTNYTPLNMQQELLETKKHNYFVSTLLHPVFRTAMQLRRHLLQKADIMMI